MEPIQIAGLVLLLVFAFLIIFFSNRVQELGSPILRPIPAFSTIKEALARSIEAGRKLHISLGIGGIADRANADTLAGLDVVDYVTKQTSAAQLPTIVTTADATAMLLTQERVRQAYQADKLGSVQAAAQIRWVSPQPAAYAAGVMGVLNIEEDVEANIFAGQFSDEYLLFGEAANRQTPHQTTVAGTGDPNVLPYVYATSDQSLWGEELYAVGAYLSEEPAKVGSLLAQDTVRWLLSIVILSGVILKAFEVIG